jgi:hypothetical protein
MKTIGLAVAFPASITRKVTPCSTATLLSAGSAQAGIAVTLRAAINIVATI